MNSKETKSTGRCKETGVKKEKIVETSANSSSNIIIVQGFPRQHLITNLSSEDHDTIKQFYTEEIKQLFSTYGTVTACDAYIYHTDDVRNFAHITYADSSSAIRAAETIANRETDKCISLTVTLVSDDYAPIEELNDDCLNCIFSLLKDRDRFNFDRVCKPWKNLAMRSWCRVKKFYGRDISPGLFKQYIVRCGRYLEDLSYSLQTPGSSSLVIQYCRNVKTMRICCALGNVREECRGIKKLRKLKSLILENFGNSVNYDIMSILPKSLEEIQLVTQSFFYIYVDGLGSQDCSKLKNLRKIVVHGMTIKDTSIKDLRNLKKLAHLDICHCDGNSSVLKEIQHLKNLKFLGLADFSIPNNTLRNIVKANHGLRYLDISYSQSLTDNSLRAVLKLPHLKFLKMIDVQNVNLTCLDTVINLEYLNCEWCINVGDEGSQRVIYLCPILKYFNIRKCNITSNFFVTAAGITENRNNNVALTLITEKSVALDKQYSLLTIMRHSPCWVEHAFMEAKNHSNYDN